MAGRLAPTVRTNSMQRSRPDCATRLPLFGRPPPGPVTVMRGNNALLRIVLADRESLGTRCVSTFSPSTNK
jgi:hypothetical protein